jgi:hypothetical protein
MLLLFITHSSLIDLCQTIWTTAVPQAYLSICLRYTQSYLPLSLPQPGTLFIHHPTHSSPHNQVYRISHIYIIPYFMCLLPIFPNRPVIYPEAVSKISRPAYIAAHQLKSIFYYSMLWVGGSCSAINDIYLSICRRFCFSPFHLPLSWSAVASPLFTFLYSPP